MLLVVGWSSVVVWLNVRPRRDSNRIYLDLQGRDFVYYQYGCPLPYVGTDHYSLETTPGFRPQFAINYRHLTANIAIGILAVTVLTFASKHLLRAIVALLRAFMSKPPPADVDGD